MFIIGVVCWIISIQFSGIGVGCCQYGLYPIDVIGASAGTVVIYLLSQSICRLPKPIRRCVSYFGQYSMVVLCMHYLEQIIDINNRLNIQYWYLYLTTEFMFIIPMTYFCTKNKLTRYIFQVKP